MLAETPQNGEYLAAAYAIAVVILLAYWVRLWKRVKESGSGKRKT